MDHGRRASVTFIALGSITRRTNISTTTISRVLRSGNHFSGRAHRLILGAIRRVNCIPSRHTQSVHSSTAGAINLLIPSLHGTCFTRLISSVRRNLCTRKFSALVNASTRAMGQRSTFVGGLLKRHVSNTVIIPRKSSSPNIGSLVTQSLPLIFISQHMRKVRSIPFIISSPCANVHRTVRRLITLKRQHVKCVTRSSLRSCDIGRHRMTFQATTPRLLRKSANVIISYNSACRSQYRAISCLLRYNIATVVYTCSPSTVAVVNLLRSHNVRLNARVSLVSFSSVTPFHLVAPGVSIVSRRTRRVKHRNISLLLRTVRSNIRRNNDAVRIPAICLSQKSITEIIISTR